MLISARSSARANRINDARTLGSKTELRCSPAARKAPLTDQQIAAGASKLDASQTKALGDNFSSSLAAVTDNPLVKEGLSKEIAPKLGGIIGALL
jgi:hypothetical protein